MTREDKERSASPPLPTPTPLEWTTVQTAIPAVPLPPMNRRPEVRTKRLILRQIQASDLPAWRAMLSQSSTVIWTPQGQAVRDEAWYASRLQKNLAPEGDDKYNFAICLAETGEMMGTGGCHKLAGELGWPIIGYGLRSEFWGHGYAIEFLEGFLSAWWALPRVRVEVRVERSTLPTDARDGDSVEECIEAVTLEDNVASQKVLTKCKFERAKVWEDADIRDPEKTVVLHGFVARRPERLLTGIIE